MSIQNVKILLRRGLRSQLANTTLATGEMGFTTDTNQLFVGIDPSVNEVQFDPFANAYAVIESWLDSADNPFPGLKIDEDLVIRNIPDRDVDGNEIDGVGVLLNAMQFFTQTVVLEEASEDLLTGDVLYQYRFVYDNNDVDIENLEAGATYRILDTDGDNNEFLNSISGADRTWAKYDNVTVRDDYENDVTPNGDPILIKVVDVRYYTSGTVTNTADNVFTLQAPEGTPYFIQDAPNNENYYHFNGNENDLLTSDFGLFRYDGTSWVKQEVEIIDEAEDADKIEAYDFDGVELDKPTDTHGTDGEYAVVTKSSKVPYWHKIDGVWELLGSEKVEFEILGEDALVENTAIQSIPESIIAAVNTYPNGRFVIELDENFDPDEESWVESVATVEFVNDPDNTDVVISGIVTLQKELDCIEDQLKISYYYNNDFQFSSNPPVTFTNQSGTYSPPALRSTEDALQDGDHYVYIDKDIGTGLKLNMFKWSAVDREHVHTPVPFYTSPDPENIPVNEIATENAPDSVLVYAAPLYNEQYRHHPIIELNQRDYSASTIWYPFDNSDVLSYYFSTSATPLVNDADAMYASSVSGEYDFPAAFYGRARTNVEVVTENSFNQLFADQHLTSEDEYSGMRPSLFKKVLPNEEGVFLKYDKNVCTTFFIDYSLKQTKDDVTFLRVGQLKIINGYPHGIEKIKLTDENTEMWQDDGDGVADRDEFSNLTFSTAIQDTDPDPANTVDGKNIFIMYTQEQGWNTEVSYTVKRWTM